MISVKNLIFSYVKTRDPVIRGLEFHINDGEIFGFLGPSGAGKSTTQKILIGLLQRYEGEISIFGKDLSAWKSDFYEKIGVSFEVPNLYLKLTALENLNYFGGLYSGRTLQPQALLDLVGLNSDGHMRVSEYSKGMKNRLNVARSLLHNPQLLFMDEPTAGLDPVNARLIKDLIKAQKEAGKTIFLTTHDMTVADELCDQVAFIVDGELKSIGRPRELKLQHGESRVRVEYRGDHGIRYTEFSLAHLGNNQSFLDLLQQGRVQTIHSQEATLDQVFIKVTGRDLS